MKTSGLHGYRNVQSDFQNAQMDMEQYKADLNEKIAILEFLLNHYNDAKRKKFYCLAVNLLQLEDLKELMAEITQKINRSNIEHSDKIMSIIAIIENKAKEENIELKLRKK